ncbi:MAG: alpha-hydroxy-acid oxidizing protein [Chitinophagaceae bacterium]|nr:MAG: alpha-hydroxy-acid oxidizing protein [Chitinophagaceae bacterium]
MAELQYNPRYPNIDYLRRKAKKRMPGFAFDYLSGGCNEEINLRKNTEDIRKIELMPQYLKKHTGSDMKTALFGHVYDAPFGIAPVGLQGLIWPNSPEILAKAAVKHNIPFILSTVSTSSIERIAEITQGRAWFQLYHPADNDLRDKILERAAANCPVLVMLSDVPTFGYRSKEIKNGLAMPPRMTFKNVMQIIGHPDWAINTLIHGTPAFETLKPYMRKGMNMHHLGLYMNSTFNGRLDEDRVAAIRDKWKGKLVMKGMSNEVDVEKAVRLGLDGVIVSNHGGRQLDAGPSSVHALKNIAAKYGDKIKVMMDSGIRTGPDIARTLAAGAQFTFLGRSFMYGVGALGNKGGDHTISILKRQLQQVMEQICCEKVEEFPKYLINNKGENGY